MPHKAEPHGRAPGSVRRLREREKKMWARALIVVSVERNRQGRVSRFRID